MFCSKCGNEIEENSNFCSKCGNEIHTIKKEPVCPTVEEPVKNEAKKKNNRTGIYILSFICIILVGILIFQSIPEKTEKTQDAYLKVIEKEVKHKIDTNENIPPVAKEIAKSAIDKVDTKEDLDKAITIVSDKVTELGVEKEKIDNLVKDLESYKDKKELKASPVLETVYTKVIDFIDSLKKSLNLSNNSSEAKKAIKEDSAEKN